MRKRIISALLAFTLLFSTFGITNGRAARYSDVSSSKWYSEAVSYVSDNKLMNGTSSTAFEPNSSLTRAMFVTILGRLAGVNTSQYSGNNFADTQAGKWYSPYVAWAVSCGVTKGYSDGTFRPSESITREQMATMLARYVAKHRVNLNFSGTRTESFSDYWDTSLWAISAVFYMRASGLIQGDSRGAFNPRGTATRAEAATVFMRLRKAIVTDAGSGTTSSVIYSILDGLDSLDGHSQDHILGSGHDHHWDLLVPDEAWAEVKSIIAVVMAVGTERPQGDSKTVYVRSAEIQGHTVEVTYTYVNGDIRISNAWVKVDENSSGNGNSVDVSGGGHGGFGGGSGHGGGGGRA